jgi:alkyldihydroxyacetonephosphate synthase
VLDEREAALNGAALDGSALLLLGFESADHPQGDLLARALRLAEDLGGRCPEGPRVREGEGPRASTEDGAEAWRAAFVDAPYLQTNLVSLGILADTFETATTWSSFPELHRALVSEMRRAMKRLAGAGRLSCRFTHVYPDGPAPYYTFICPVRPGGEQEIWQELKATASETLLAHGATITHHHAVGRTHAPWYRRQSAPRFLGALEGAKRALDPRGIMNPGALLTS